MRLLILILLLSTSINCTGEKPNKNPEIKQALSVINFVFTGSDAVNLKEEDAAKIFDCMKSRMNSYKIVSSQLMQSKANSFKVRFETAVRLDSSAIRFYNFILRSQGKFEFRLLSSPERLNKFIIAIDERCDSIGKRNLSSHLVALGEHVAAKNEHVSYIQSLFDLVLLTKLFANEFTDCSFLWGHNIIEKEVFNIVEKGIFKYRTVYLVEGESVFTNEDFDTVQAAEIIGSDKEYLVECILKPEATKRFNIFTSVNVGKFAAFIVDGMVYSAPQIKEPVENNTLQITNLSYTEVLALVEILRSPRYTVEIEIKSIEISQL